MTGTGGTSRSRMRRLAAVVALVVGSWLLLFGIAFVMVFVFEPDARSASRGVATGLLTLTAGLTGGLSIRWGVRRLGSRAADLRRRTRGGDRPRTIDQLPDEFRSAGSRRRARRNEYRRMVDELPDDLGWFKRNAAKQEIRKGLGFKEVGARYARRHRDVIAALTGAGHDPQVTGRWVDGSEYSGGGWQFGLTCRRCHQRYRGRLLRRFGGLSPDRPCVPSWGG